MRHRTRVPVLISSDDFYTFIRLANFESPGRPVQWAHRARAAAGLAYCAGLWLPEILALRRRHWCPEGRDLVVVNGDRVVGEQGSQTHRRILPVSPAARYLVGQFLGALRPDGLDQDDRFFAMEGAPPLKLELRNAARRSPIEPEVKPGDLRGSFESIIIGLHPKDPLAYYLVGRAASPEMSDPFSETDPPIDDLRRLLKDSHPVYADDERLWRRAA